MKSKHGAYRLQGRNDVLCLVMEGSVPLQLVQAMRAEMAEFWRSRAGRPWALYSDVLRFEAMPPEALEAFWALISEASEHGLLAATDVRRPDHFRVSKAEQLQQGTRKISFRISANEQEAMQWIASFGLQVD